MGIALPSAWSRMELGKRAGLHPFIPSILSIPSILPFPPSPLSLHPSLPSVPIIPSIPPSLHPSLPIRSSSSRGDAQGRWDRVSALGAWWSLTAASRWRWPQCSIHAGGRGQPSGGWGSAGLSERWQSGPLGTPNWSNWSGGRCPFPFALQFCKPPLATGVGDGYPLPCMCLVQKLCNRGAMPGLG